MKPFFLKPVDVARSLTIINFIFNPRSVFVFLVWFLTAYKAYLSKSK